MTRLQNQQKLIEPAKALKGAFFLTVKSAEKGREEMCTLVEDYAEDYARDAVKANTKEIARKLLQTGADVAYVIKCTGLSQEDVLEIKEEEDL